MWVIRDFSLQLVDDHENEINAKQYLENALKEVEISSTRAYDEDSIMVIQRKNEIRSTLSQFFTDRDCHTLIRPVSDERKLRDV